MSLEEMLREVLEALPELLENGRRMQRFLDEQVRTVPPPEPERADDLVDADYFARVTGLSPVTIRQGKAGTAAVPLASKRPKRWRKGNVDRFVREREAALRPPRQKAFRLLDRGGGRGRRPAA